MEKRKDWLHNQRQIKILRAKVQKVDQEQVIEDKRFEEAMTYHNRAKLKVEDWFSNNKLK